MTQFARVESNSVLEVREIEESAIPEHKRQLWRPVVYEGSGDLTETIIEANQVRVVRSERPLATIKVELKALIDADAERRRLAYITPGAGMAVTYDEKHAQARAVALLGEEAANALTEEQRADQFPVLSASVGIEGATLWDCSALVIARYEAFADLAGVIERTRLTAKKAISDASDVAAARAAYEAVAWTV